MYDLTAYINTVNGDKRTIFVDAVQKTVDNVVLVNISGVSRFPINGEFGAAIEFKIPNRTPLLRRKFPEFSGYFDKLWKELGVNEGE